MNSIIIALALAEYFLPIPIVLLLHSEPSKLFIGHRFYSISLLLFGTLFIIALVLSRRGTKDSMPIQSTTIVDPQQKIPSIWKDIRRISGFTMVFAFLGWVFTS